MRPRSIILFERVYWLHIVAAAAWLTWSFLRMGHAVPPGGLEHPDRIRMLAVGVTSIVSIGIELLLWYFIARRGSNLARWIFAIFFGLAVLSMVALGIRFAQGALSPVRLGVPLLTMSLRIVSLWLLFRPDAAAWFRGRHSPEELLDTFS
jgi:hypothetical protein